MKNSLKIMGCVIVIACTLLTSCGLFKKRVASNSQVKLLNKGSVQIDNKPPVLKKDTHIMVEKKKDHDVHIPTTSADLPETTPTPTLTAPSFSSTEVVVPLPPLEVEKVFVSNFPAAKQVVWNKVKVSEMSDFKTTPGYKVDFVLGGTKNMVIYDEKADLVEIREEIRPEQLPPNVYNAIKNQYPSVYILSATAVRKSKIHGAYAAIIRPYVQSEQIEVILRENGTFIK